MDNQFSIGALAKEVGVKVVTIRYYEQIGILPSPERTEGIIAAIRWYTSKSCVSFAVAANWAFLLNRFETCSVCPLRVQERAKRCARWLSGTWPWWRQS